MEAMGENVARLIKAGGGTAPWGESIVLVNIDTDKDPPRVTPVGLPVLAEVRVRVHVRGDSISIFPIIREPITLTAHRDADGVAVFHGEGAVWWCRQPIQAGGDLTVAPVDEAGHQIGLDQGITELGWTKLADGR